jgi:MFS family permease
VSRLSSSWIRLLALFTLASFIENAFAGQMYAFTPLYLPHLGVAEADVPLWTGVIVAISSSAGIPFLPFWGALADRYARQPIIVRSFVANLVAGIVALLAGDIWVFVLGRTVMSLSLGYVGLMMTTLSERAPRERQGITFSVMNSAAPIGAFVGPLFGGPIVDAWGFPALLSINSALLVAVVLALMFGYQDNFKGANSGPILSMAADSVRIIWRSRRLRALFPSLFVLFAGWILAYTYVPLAITALYRGNEPGTAVGLILGAGGLTGFVISPAIGMLADRFGNWRVLLTGIAMEIILWPLPAFAPDLLSFGIAWAMINGLAVGTSGLPFSVLANSASSDVRGRVMSFAFLPLNVAFAVGPMIGSVVTRGSVFAVFPVAALITLLGVIALVAAVRQDAAPSDQPVPGAREE